MRVPLCMLLLAVFAAACQDSTTDKTKLDEPPYTALSDSLRKDPSNADLHYRRAALLFSNNENEAAEKDMRAAWQLHPDETNGLGLTRLLMAKNPDSAIAFLKQASLQLPGSVAFRVGLAQGYQSKNRPDLALAICDEILEKFPGQLDALSLKADLLKFSNQENAAMQTLEQAYSYAPGDPELAHKLAFMYAEGGNIKAIALSDSLIAADARQQHAEPYFFKGVYYSNVGKPDLAIKSFDAAISHNYNYIEAYVNKAIVYFDTKKYAEALKTLELAARVSPDEADPYYWMGKTQEAMGDLQNAKLNYLRAYGLDATNKEARAAADRIQ